MYFVECCYLTIIDKEAMGKKCKAETRQSWNITVIGSMTRGAINTMMHGAGNSRTMKYMRPIVDNCVEGWRRVHRDDVSLPELFRRSDGPKLVFRNFALG